MYSGDLSGHKALYRQVKSLYMYTRHEILRRESLKLDAREDFTEGEHHKREGDVRVENDRERHSDCRREELKLAQALGVTLANLEKY